MNHSTEPSTDLSSALPAALREVEDFLAEAGWDQPPRLFALVSTAALLAAEPGLAGSLAAGSGLTPVAQDPVGASDLATTLDAICWPAGVSGCALAQDIVVLPPTAEVELDRVIGGAGAGTTVFECGTSRANAADAELDRVAVRFAQSHPDRRDARLVVGVLRSGEQCCLLRVRGVGDEPDQLVEHPDLAPNMVNALRSTLES